ncbi:hypothetical protein [Corallococcus macrosporus]|uniref:Cyclophilin-type peptidylprolyl cis-trans isomerase n=1 Tax=Myxococcus fulvus (strain ATCC BAA-855 / HW-1) TaxID=483219 RepID=F8CDH8_MYXFH|nr:hypothetical protein [Corallococcus macrosporus]AEI67285.1 cyclophilin-type peptidylprolyl cis-trans isomerase [Corallococcus macrosporus]
MPPASLRKTLALVTCLLAGSVLAADSGKWTRRAAAGKDLYATLQPSQGHIVLRRSAKDAPAGVAAPAAGKAAAPRKDAGAKTVSPRP